MTDLTPEGQFLRDRCAQPDDQRHPSDPVRQSASGYVPCALEHTPGRLCLHREGHAPLVRHERACKACGAALGDPCVTIVDGVDTGWDHDVRILGEIIDDIRARS